MKNIILGDGITGYIIAACLDYNNEKALIIGDGKYKAPEILLLKYKNKEMLEEYFHIFGIDYTDENIKKFTRKIKIGYTNDFCKTIVSKPTQEMIDDYLKKQDRESTNSNMSDNLNNFNAIDLKLVYNHLKTAYKKWYKCTKNIKIQNFPVNFGKNNVTVYNTIFNTEFNDYEPSIEYICTAKNDINNYDYVYDCNKNSRIKRYTKYTTEYISNPGYYDFTIKNYYNAPAIYSKCNIKNNITWIDISRNATKTQLKQEDIIKYIVQYE